MGEAIIVKRTGGGTNFDFSAANGSAAQLLNGYKMWNNSGELVTGGMANQGAVSNSLKPGNTYTIPAGYHNGGGKVTTNLAGANGSAAQLLNGYSMWNNANGLVAGTMLNRGAVNVTIEPGGSYTIPAGYHNGGGKVTANSAETDFSAATGGAAHLLTGYKMWDNTGSLVNGSMANQGAVTATIGPGNTYTIPAGYHNGGGKVTATGGFKNVLKTEIITINTDWVVPSAKDNSFSVRIFGGGGSGNNKGGGGGGWMNNNVLNLNAGDTIRIVLGDGGTWSWDSKNGFIANTGGTSTFGSYLSANGGSGGTNNGGSGGSGGGGWEGGKGYQFGGGGGYCNGGDGGTYGGGGGAGRWIGGNGGTYGGGGGGGSYNGTVTNLNGGNGGTYGGGGGSGATLWQSSSYDRAGSGTPGVGGQYGGNGGRGWYNYENRTKYLAGTNAENGTNTSTWTNVFNDGNGYFRGWGRAGASYSEDTNSSNYTSVAGGAGGGGFGGNGGHGKLYTSNRYGAWSGGGGGGGYGSNGGNECGGGGGYGGDGGDGFSDDVDPGSGGGGGYGKSAKGGANIGGGGGFYGRGGNGFPFWSAGGGGGGYGNGGDSDGRANDGGYAAGGGGMASGDSTFSINNHPGNGGSGICIIQYFV